MNYFSYLCGILLWCLASACTANSLPDIGSSSNTVISVAQERALGQQQMFFLRQHASLIEDPEIQEYIESIGYRLVAASTSPLPEYNFFVVNADIINAFAAPGGFIGINTGLILATQNESELAGVLGHEISHANQRHIARFYAAQSGSTWKQAGLILAAVLLGSQNPQLGSAALTAGMASSAQSQINYTREYEYEADRIGIQTLYSAQFDPNGMASFFERLADRQRFNFQVPEYLRTHPLESNRISEAKARAAQFPPRTEIESVRYYLARERIRVTTSSVDKLHALYSENTDNDSPFTTYGKALVATRLGNTQSSIKAFKSLIEKHGEYIPYYTGLAEAYIANKQWTDALNTLKNAYDLFPGNYPLTVKYADVLIATQQATKGIDLLNDLAYQRTTDPLPLKLLASAYSSNNQLARSQHAQAHYYLRIGQAKQAVILLEQAKSNTKDDKLLLAEIELQLAQLRQVKSQ